MSDPIKKRALPKSFQSKVLKKYLIKNSYLLFVIYMLSSIMLISIYSNKEMEVALLQCLSLAVCSFVIFIGNAHIIVYYKVRGYKNLSTRNIQKRIFITGYILTLVVMSLNHLFISWLASMGFNFQTPEIFASAAPWKNAMLIGYLSLMQYTFVYLIQNFTMTLYEKSRIEMQLLSLKATNAETVNLLLKQQIQPHFLFNALNTLKSLIHKSPAVAEDYLLNLSDFLRASFSDHPSGIATVQEELEICSNYMEMQEIRFGNALVYEVDIASFGQQINDFSLPVFSLQPLLENAIKHNIATTAQPLKIGVSREGAYVKVTNILQPKMSITESTGNGLTNLKERYKIISGDEVLIEKKDTHFVVRIKLLEK